MELEFEIGMKAGKEKIKIKKKNPEQSQLQSQYPFATGLNISSLSQLDNRRPSRLPIYEAPSEERSSVRISQNQAHHHDKFKKREKGILLHHKLTSQIQQFL